MPDEQLAILDRVRSNWRIKLWLGTLVTVVACAGYYFTSQFPLRTPTRLEPSIIDRAVPFSPAWTGVYLSLYLMAPLAWLAHSRQQLARYAVGMLLTGAMGWLVFMTFPVMGPRPAVVPEDGLYGIVTRIDSPLGSFPSLHIAFAMYTACFVAAVLRGARGAGLVVAGMILWTLVIAYSTLATKQHYFVDVPAGAAVGCAAHWVAWRSRAVVVRMPQPETV